MNEVHDRHCRVTRLGEASANIDVAAQCRRKTLAEQSDPAAEVMGAAHRGDFARRAADATMRSRDRIVAIDGEAQGVGWARIVECGNRHGAAAKEVPPDRLKDRFELLKGINDSMPDLEKSLKSYAIDEYYAKAFELVLSGKARDAFDLTKESDKSRERYGLTTFGQGLLLSRRLIEAGTRFVQMNWPAVANGNPEIDSWDTHAANFAPLKNLHCPKLDRGLSALLEDMDSRGLLKETLVVAVGEFGRSPRIGVSTSGNSNAPDGRDHWPYCYSGVVAGCGIARGAQYGESDQTASAPKDKPMHPNDLLATIYYALGIDPDMIVLNHLNQPRELVQGETVTGILS